MSARSRGNAFEVEVKKIYEAAGYQVERALAKLIWIPGRKFPISQSHDFFGLWDLIAKKKGEPTYWIQVTTINELSKKRKQMAASRFPLDSMDVGKIYARMIGVRPAHFRVYSHYDNYGCYNIQNVKGSL